MPLSSSLFRLFQRTIREVPHEVWFLVFHMGSSFLSGQVTEQLMQLLDTHGGCSSVANQGSIKEGKAENLYDVYAKVSLLDHTLHVAQAFSAIVTGELLIPKVIITAFAHDIGKIPELRQEMRYVTGDHPDISVIFLNSLEGIKELPGYTDIIDAVKHHHKNPVTELGQYFQQADRDARAREVGEYTTGILKGGNGMFSAAAFRSVPVVSETTEPDSSEEPGLTELHSEGKSVKTNSTSVSSGMSGSVDTSWFCPEEGLGYIREQINIVKPGNHYMAFSMPDGTVYMFVELIWQMAISIASREGVTDIVASGSSKQIKREIIIALLNQKD